MDGDKSRSSDLMEQCLERLKDKYMSGKKKMQHLLEPHPLLKE